MLIPSASRAAASATAALAFSSAAEWLAIQSHGCDGRQAHPNSDKTLTVGVILCAAVTRS